MARDALARRALEDGVDVARLAGLQLVRAGELVARGYVVEQGPGSLRRGNVPKECEQAHEDELVELAHVPVPIAAARP
jgi:hypothetical protein